MTTQPATLDARRAELLRRLGLTTAARLPPRLAQACHEGLLVGGLSLARTALPDEVLGPLLSALGGSAPTALRVVDVRTGPPMVLVLQDDSWEVPDLHALVSHLNHRFAADASVRVCVELGEWDDMCQLWCVPRTAMAAITRAHLLGPGDTAVP